MPEIAIFGTQVVGFFVTPDRHADVHHAERSATRSGGAKIDKKRSKPTISCLIYLWIWDPVDVVRVTPGGVSGGWSGRGFGQAGGLAEPGNCTVDHVYDTFQLLSGGVPGG